MKACLDEKLTKLGIEIKPDWSRQRKWQIIQRMGGKCIKCSKKAVWGAFCSKHRRANRKNAKVNYTRRKARLGFGQSSRRRVPRKFREKVVDGKVIIVE